MIIDVSIKEAKKRRKKKRLKRNLKWQRRASMSGRWLFVEVVLIDSSEETGNELQTRMYFIQVRRDSGT